LGDTVCSLAQPRGIFCVRHWTPSLRGAGLPEPALYRQTVAIIAGPLVGHQLCEHILVKATFELLGPRLKFEVFGAVFVGATFEV